MGGAPLLASRLWLTDITDAKRTATRCLLLWAPDWPLSRFEPQLTTKPLKSPSTSLGLILDDPALPVTNSAVALEPSQRVLVGDRIVVNVDRGRQLHLELGRVVEVSDSVS